VFETRRPACRAWQEWAADTGTTTRDIPGSGQVERRCEVTAVNLEIPQQGLQGQVERGEADVSLELGASRVHHAVSLRPRVLRGGLEQHRFADARLAGQQQRFAVDAEPVDGIVQVPQFVVASDDRGRLTGRRPAL
jgi:hypothetical protein